MWIQTGVTVRKRLSWVVTSVTLTFDLWPWPFAWTSLLTMVITPENFMMIRWWEHGEKGVTDRQTDGQTDRRTDRRTENTICRAAWSQLKTAARAFHAIHHKNSQWCPTVERILLRFFIDHLTDSISVCFLHQAAHMSTHTLRVLWDVYLHGEGFLADAIDGRVHVRTHDWLSLQQAAVQGCGRQTFPYSRDWIH